jgi:hypothetical protein
MGASAHAVAAARAGATRPPTCTVGTNPAIPGDCILNEGWVSGCPRTGGGCEDIVGPLGGLAQKLRPAANAFLKLHVSTSTVAVGSKVTVSASVAAPKCTYPPSAKPLLCWDTVAYYNRSRYVPSNYNGLYNPPNVLWGTRTHQCAVANETTPGDNTSCVATITRQFGPAKILADHYMVIGAEAAIELPSGNYEVDYVEVALGFGAKPKCGSAGAAPCPLKVLVSVAKRIRSGLAVHDIYDHPDQSVVDFVERKPSAASAANPLSGLRGELFQCESGCADVSVTVRDPKTHQLVEDSKVDVRVTTLTGAPGGREYICETEAETGRTMGIGDCGPGSLLDLRTDDLGQVYLRYWVPGVIEATPVTLQITATGGTCTPHPCSVAKATGVTNTDLSIEPYLIYEHSASLTQEDVTELANWAGGPSVFHLFLSGTTWAEKALTAHLKWLEGEELASEKEIEVLEHLEKAPLRGLFDAIEVYNTWTELSEHWAMIGLFLQNARLSGTGLGNNPIEQSAQAYPSYPFTKELADYNGLVPGNLGEAAGKDYGEAGALWDIATTLRSLVTAKDASVKPGGRGHWGIQVKVYEISSCDPHQQCDPGYDLDHGIHAELYFRIALLYDGHASPSGAGLYTFTTRYDALAWAEAQQSGGPQQGKLSGLLPGS